MYHVRNLKHTFTHYIIQSKLFISDEKRTIFRWINNKRRITLIDRYTYNLLLCCIQ